MAPGIDGDRAALSRHPRLRGVLKVVALWVFFVLSMSGPYLDAPWWLSWPILLLWFSTTTAAGLGVCAAVIAVPLLVVLAAVRRRSSHCVAAAAWAVAVIALLAGIHQYEQLKRRGLARAMERGAPVIAALSAHRARHGAYPAALSELVPQQLVSIPSTGLVGFPDFGYQGGGHREHELADTYELRVDCSANPGNFDRVIYWPEELYPDRFESSWTERLGRWAWLHE